MEYRDSVAMIVVTAAALCMPTAALWAFDDAIYPDLAKKYGVILYPFFLDGVAADAKLNQRDGLHPTAAGVDVIVAKILPKVEELIARAKTQH